MSEKLATVALFVMWITYVCTAGALAGMIKEPTTIISMGDMLISNVKYVKFSNLTIATLIRVERKLS